ncbi:FecCD family ABC transporter permease [Pseudobacteriovorax antillogorgiicola]|uniref:Iron complex transport system permease protein n=1 Tax=Pseudobacteriovorax antillogorgiicola TaxID=1513793 RepID=A0A1Y6BDX7_9BACT|nr:iron ABC transporter permease [Pseudobacteriovorax antillogorgiicola]TCS56468.1 iron complex transport system permease protein [Pseudobacteriovorax antillogorgiicola]SMF05114.1 iron complex transport system permease protein [Pseudobacteriovorax antillogorgiicola]
MRSKVSPLAAYIWSFSLLTFVLLWAISWGPQGWQLVSQVDDPLRRIILWDIRLPRVLVSALCGGALAMAGVLSQGLFRNPLAGPSILGTVSGANLFVVTTMFLGWGYEHWLVQPFSAFIGAVLATSLVWRLSTWQSFQNPGRLLLLGFAINSIFAATTTFLLSLSLHEFNLSQSILFWLMGSFNGKGWPHVLMALPWLLIGLWLSRPIARRLNVLNLGEDVAQSLNVPISQLRWQTIAVIAGLVGASVAVAGGISFVGLMVPHFTRLYLGADHRHLVKVSCINGMILVVAADTISRTLMAPQELQVGAILSLIGAPVFVGLMLKERGRHGF